MEFLTVVLAAAVRSGTPVLYASLGEVVSERAGVMNLGLEGIMLVGAYAGFAVTMATGDPWFGIAASFAAGCAITLIHAFLCITLMCNQVVSGLAMVLTGYGLSALMGRSAIGQTIQGMKQMNLPLLADIPFIGPIFFQHNAMVYLSYILVVFLCWFIFFTRPGLNLRAVGESPATADAAGINVTKYKYLATCLGGAMTGLGGLYLVMNAGAGVGGAWVHNCINGYGWLAVALVIFAVWNPKRALWCSLIFGGLACMRYYYPISFIPASIYDIGPYIVTAVVLVAVSLKHNRSNQPPESLGLSYFREER